MTLARSLHPCSGPSRVYALLVAENRPLTAAEVRGRVPGWINLRSALPALERAGRVEVLSESRPFRYRAVA